MIISNNFNDEIESEECNWFISFFTGVMGEECRLSVSNVKFCVS